ncbi:PAS domain-containing protein [Sulfitobacter sp. W002]|uniref:PAS domain-containing protein n=1 Tax=Sulfitobacter sp. W002 TaxID=2867024 RepID=UPI0021A957E5|nr:PAS domain-containing protein [Sulfitobacter sp. W002]UWR29896.1 PAS domain-containing protein [Sulfitobacter sp. W002]
MNDKTVLAARQTLTDDVLGKVVRYARLPLCITDPTLPDNPIVYVNEAFTDLTGYRLEEIVGQNCRFLQGPDTKRESIDAVRNILLDRRVDTVEIVNYRKDGSRFLNALQLGPINDEDGNLIYFFGSQLDVSERRRLESEHRKLADDELLHRLRNIVNVMTAMVRLTAREEPTPAAFANKVIDRLSALGAAHFDTIGRSDQQEVDFKTLIGPIIRAYTSATEEQINLSGANPLISHRLVSPLTLALHELATNAVKHGALSTETGRVSLDIALLQAPARLRFVWQEIGGPEVTKSDRDSGSRIIQSLTRAVGGTLQYDWQPDGLIATAEFPIGQD